MYRSLYNTIFRKCAMNRILVLIIAIIITGGGIMAAMSAPFFVKANEQETNGNPKSSALTLQAPSAILMEASTGQIIYEKNADEPLPPASVTKIMTLLLIFDALEEGRIKLEDEVVVSENAASMGGSQVFLEVGEKQTVDTMIKCISMASANDASVAMAEHISGSQEAFVGAMNERAAGLGMSNTHFINTCGLDVSGHVSSARDIALMSRELITKYPQISKYSTIWMDTIIHSTRKGDTEFGLTNTNKLIKQYEWATGLKTGSTSKAGCCLSATANKDGIELIAVILAAPNSKTRFAEAISLLNYGYSVCNIYVDDNMLPLEDVIISGAKNHKTPIQYAHKFSYMFMDKADPNAITKELVINEGLQAPLKKGDVVGKVTYYYNGESIGSVDIVASENADKATFADTLKKLLDKLLF